MDAIDTDKLNQEADLTENPTPAVPQEETAENQVTSTEEVLPIESATSKCTAAECLEQLKKQIASEQPDKERIEAIKAVFYKLHKQEVEAAKQAFVDAGNAIEEFNMEEANLLETAFKSQLNIWREKRAQQIATIEKEKQDNLEKKNQIIEAIRQLTESTEDIRKNLPEFRRLQQEWKEVGIVAQEQVNELWRRYQLEVEKFYDQIRINNDFRDYDFKKNLETKTQLCQAAEKLMEESDIVVAFKRLQKMHDEWRETGPVAKELREEIWQRFKNASTEINKKYQGFFERLKDIENENLAQKNAICEAIEAIDVEKMDKFKDWDKKTNEVIELQERWKTIGFAPKKANTKIFERYRAACDRFFQAKSAFYKSTKESLLVNLEKKKALCEKAEALKNSTDWNATANQLIQIQKEWKSIGPVPRKQSESLWKSFIASCDYFFEQKEKNTSSQKQIENQNLEAKKALIEKLSQFKDEITPEDAMKMVRELNTQWNEIGFVPFKEKDKIYKQWHSAMNAFMERFNIDKTSRRLNSFQSNLEEIKSKGQGKVMHERDRLMRQFESLSNEIKTCENNIGFFNLSKSSGSALLKEMNKNIEKLKEERDLIYKKIQLIDQEA